VRDRCCNHRIGSFRGLSRSVNAPTRNCLDFGWRDRRLDSAGKDLRRRGHLPNQPAPQVPHDGAPPRWLPTLCCFSPGRVFERALGFGAARAGLLRDSPARARSPQRMVSDDEIGKAGGRRSPPFQEAMERVGQFRRQHQAISPSLCGPDDPPIKARAGLDHLKALGESYDDVVVRNPDPWALSHRQNS
jgi:hypothetical protein